MGEHLGAAADLACGAQFFHEVSHGEALFYVGGGVEFAAGVDGVGVLLDDLGGQRYVLGDDNIVMRGDLSNADFVDGGAGRVNFLDNQVPVTADGVFMLGMGRDTPKQVTLKVMISEGHNCEQVFTVEQRDYRIQRVEGVPKKTVNPGPEYYTRIRTEAAAARQARAERLDLPYYLQSFQWPLTGPISGVYGSQRYYNGTPKRPHYGVDIARPTGTKVMAPAGGVVTLAHDDMFFSGGTLILDHGQGLSSSFLHLSKLLVEVGQVVEAGQLIAEVGATGRVTGPHLDWRMNWLNQRVDPQLLVPAMP